ncbi:MAG TPA: hypothetical protein VFW23_19620 [Tepidisphaeraceae bacterium]|nr:hypothetical protein [Tepidisphaeraceae bacterium]
MATSKIPGIWRHDASVFAPIPARTPGIWGILDQGDITVWTLAGDSGGPVGFEDHGMCLLGGGYGQALQAQNTIPSAGDTPVAEEKDEEVLLLAAVAYGESSAKDLFQEMAGIATVMVSQRDARDQTLKELLAQGSTFAYAASDGNPRTAAFHKASPHARNISHGMSMAIKAAHHALDYGEDYSNGAYFWDGLDIKIKDRKHFRVLKGIKFTKPEHNIYHMEESRVNITIHEKIHKDGKLVDGAVRGNYTYVFESTAAWGGTIFWQYSKDFLKATRNTEYD